MASHSSTTQGFPEELSEIGTRRQRQLAEKFLGFLVRKRGAQITNAWLIFVFCAQRVSFQGWLLSSRSKQEGDGEANAMATTGIYFSF